LAGAIAAVAGCGGSESSGSSSDASAADTTVYDASNVGDAGADASTDARLSDAPPADATDAGGAEGPNSSGDASPPVNVLEHHLHPQRDGAYIDSLITKTSAATLAVDPNFKATITGIVYGQPLFVDGLGTGPDIVLVATDHNEVAALDSSSGATIWHQTLGPFLTQASDLPCGQPYPYYGVMATPVIDVTTRTVYVESFQLVGTTPTHYVYALSLDDGTTRSGWPVDVAAAVTGFDATTQNDRGALALLGGTLYVPYAGLNGDCGTYHGYVIGIDTKKPATVKSYATGASRGGIWAAVATDGVSSVFAVTGNTGSATSWAGGEALLRFTQGPVFSGNTSDYFTPSNWQMLDSSDADLGSSSPILFDVPGATPSTLAQVGGKFGVLHIVNRAALGGKASGDGMTGEGVVSMRVTTGQLKGTQASYASAAGRYVVVRSTDAEISVCPGGTSGDLLALQVTATNPPTLVPRWCASSGGSGSLMATTSDGTSDALVWNVSSGGANVLQAFDGDTGALVFKGSAGLTGGIAQWATPIVAKGRFYVGGHGTVFAYGTH
jgi:hypothetical protein